MKKEKNWLMLRYERAVYTVHHSSNYDGKVTMFGTLQALIIRLFIPIRIHTLKMSSSVTQAWVSERERKREETVFLVLSLILLLFLQHIQQRGKENEKIAQAQARHCTNSIIVERSWHTGRVFVSHIVCMKHTFEMGTIFILWAMLCARVCERA